MVNISLANHQRGSIVTESMCAGIEVTRKTSVSKVCVLTGQIPFYLPL